MTRPANFGHADASAGIELYELPFEWNAHFGKQRLHRSVNDGANRAFGKLRRTMEVSQLQGKIGQLALGTRVNDEHLAFTELYSDEGGA